MPSPHLSSVPVTRLALGGVVAVILLNLLLRTFVKLGGALATLVIASAVAGAMALWFYLQHQRRPTTSERRQLLALYSSSLALLYLGLLALMAWQDNPSPMALVIFGLHYFCYPGMAWVIFRNYRTGD